ncbi:hypothetical protein QTI33_31900 [Variovorax sp. J22P271]|uniref:hypothetical protein n=1 Tax=Variovorax davisae TaxID=3053515 RepID=UPI002577B982|nr:hypothetical protein [Variovorax sp. J22P271]MDM0036777.1 hypothetical protein [Variovorax sp. J22P271]
MRKPDDPHEGEQVASAGSYRVYKVNTSKGTVAYELVGPDGVTMPPVFGQVHEAMAAMTALLARPIADDVGGATAPPTLPDA